MKNSDLGKLIIKGKRGWIFWTYLGIKFCWAYLLGSWAIETFPYAFSEKTQFEGGSTPNDFKISLVLLYLPLIFSVLLSIVNHIYKGTKGSIKIFENGISLGKIALLYPNIKKVRYGKLDKKDTTESLIIYSENLGNIHFLPSDYSNRSEIIERVKQKIVEKLEKADFKV